MKNFFDKMPNQTSFIKRTCLIIFIISLIVNGLHATTYTWGGGTGDWSDGTKWLPNGIPNGLDNAIINSGVVNLGENNSVSIESLTLNDGSIVGDNTTFDISNLYWNGGTISHLREVNISEDCIIGSSNTHYLYQARLFPKSNCMWDNGDINFCDGGIIEIGTDYTLYVNGSSDKKMYDSCNTGISRFYLLGNFEKSGAGILTIEDVAIEQNANSIISVFEGTLLLKMHGYYLEVFQGTFDVSDGATLNFGGGDPQIDGATFIGDGDFVVEKCTVNFKADATFPKIKLLERGKLGGDFNITIEGETDWQGGGFIGTGTVNLNGYVLMSSAFLKEIFTKTVILNAGGTWSEGFIRFCDGAILRVPVGQTLLENGVSKPPLRENLLCFGVGFYDIQGTFIHDSFEAHLYTFRNTGSVISQSGVMYTSLSTYTNNFHIAANAKLVLLGGEIDNFNYTGEGVLGLLGNFNFNSNKTFHNLEIGATGYKTTLKGNVDFTITGTFGWGAGGFDGTGTVNVLGQTFMKIDIGSDSTHSLRDKTVNLTGGGIWSKGHLHMCGSAILKVPTGATLTVTGYNKSTYEYGAGQDFCSNNGGSLVIGGSLVKNGVGTLLIYNIENFDTNNGSIIVNEGVLKITQETELNNVSFTVNASGKLQFDGIITINNVVFNGNGVFNINNGSQVTLKRNIIFPNLDLSGSILGGFGLTIEGSFNHSGRLENTGTTNVDGKCTWRTGNFKGGLVNLNGFTEIVDAVEHLVHGGEVRLNGNGLWADGDIEILSGKLTISVGSVLTETKGRTIDFGPTLYPPKITPKLIKGVVGPFNIPSNDGSTPPGIFEVKGTFDIIGPDEIDSFNIVDVRGCQFKNSGLVRINSGTLAFSTNQTLSGAFDVKKDATIICYTLQHFPIVPTTTINLDNFQMSGQGYFFAGFSGFGYFSRVNIDNGSRSQIHLQSNSVITNARIHDKITGSANLEVETIIITADIDGTGSIISKVDADIYHLSVKKGVFQINGTAKWSSLSRHPDIEVCDNGTFRIAPTGVFTARALILSSYSASGAVTTEENNIRQCSPGQGHIDIQGEFKVLPSNKPSGNRSLEIFDAKVTNTGKITVHKVEGHAFFYTNIPSTPNNFINTGKIGGTGDFLINTSTSNVFDNRGTIAPGLSPGTLSMNFINSTPSTVYEMEITNNQTDKLILTYAENHVLKGTVKLILNSPTTGSYTIFDAPDGTIDFSNIAVLYSVNGGAFTATPPPNMNIQVNANSVVVNITGTVLPLELLTFQAQNTEGPNKLTWQTATETNTSHFDIERSPDGKTFEKIGEVKAKGSNSVYQYLDKIGAFSTIYYRLKINDLDGKSDYSKVVNLSAKVKGFSAKVYPNPLKDQATIEISTEQKTDVTIELYDMIGRQVKRLKVENTEGVVTMPLSMNDLSSGTYFLKISNNTNVIQQKIVKQ
jgi:Secretion system C-terminal sorting domain